MFYYIWMVWSCLCGYLFTMAWRGSRKARNAPKELNDRYHWFTHPNLHKWNYWTMLIQSFSIMPVRILIYILAHCVVGIVHASLGTVGEENYIKRRISNWTLGCCGPVVLTVAGFRLEKRHADVDYSKWLGPNWKQELAEFKKKNKVGTFVANHSGGFLDTQTLFSSNFGNLAVVASANFRGVPIVGKAINAGDGIYVDREASREVRGKSVDTISERQTSL